MRAFAAFALAFISLVASDAAGQPQPKAFVCHFPGGTVSTFESDWRTGPVGEAVELTFVAFDRAAAKAQLLGVLGSTEVLMAWGAHSANFVETTSTGDITLTTVFFGQAARGRLPAIHTRHVAASGEPVVSQLPGSCEAKG